MRRLLMAVLIAGLAAAGLGAATGAGWFTGWGATAADRPEAAGMAPGYHARFEQAMTVGGLAVVVERGKRQPVAGRKTTYTIAVGNRGTSTEQVVIRAVVPPWLAPLRVDRGGEAGDGFVDWHLTLAPGEASEVQLTGAYARPGTAAPEHVAFTACAHRPGNGEPIVCATDVATVRAPTAARWLAIGMVGFALLAGVVAARTMLPGRRLAGFTWPGIPAPARRLWYVQRGRRRTPR